MVSMRRLSDETVAKYEALEASGEINQRQKQMLASHRAMVAFSDRLDRGQSFDAALHLSATELEVKKRSIRNEE